MPRGGVRLEAKHLAQQIDQDHCVLTRAGLHCAPEVHRILGTMETGAVRFSLGWASTREDVEAAVTAVEAAVASPAVSVG